MSTRTEVHESQLSDTVRAYYDRAPALKTLPGLRTGQPRLLRGRTNLLIKPRSFVYMTHYSTDGGIIREEAWRADGGTVYEEIEFHKGGASNVAARVEVFLDGQWTEVDWNTGERKHT